MTMSTIPDSSKTNVGLCDNHLVMLERAMEAIGLGGLIEKDRASNRTQKLLDAQEKVGLKKSNFDPLIEGQKAVTSLILNEVATLEELTSAKPNPKHTGFLDGVAIVCPVCFIVAHCMCGKGNDCEFHTVVLKAAEVTFDKAKELGVVGVT